MAQALSMTEYAPGQHIMLTPSLEIIEPDFDDAEFELQDIARHWAQYDVREAA